MLEEFNFTLIVVTFIFSDFFLILKLSINLKLTRLNTKTFSCGEGEDQVKREFERVSTVTEKTNLRVLNMV